MPLFLGFAIIAVVAAIVINTRSGERDGGRRFLGSAVAIWVTLVVVALVLLTVGTLIFGR